MLLPMQGGKGNKGMFIERVREVCAAGLPSAQPQETAADCFSSYSLQDEVNALVGDIIEPEPKPNKLPPLRTIYIEPAVIKKPIKDVRNAGPFTEAQPLLNPPVKTKFETMVQEFKSTVYASYWKKPVGAVRDQAPNLPEGFNILKTTLGMKTPNQGSLYDLVMPKIAMPNETPVAKAPAFQTHRNYLTPYNPDLTFGKRNNADPSGKCMKHCLADKITEAGDQNKQINSFRLVDYTFANQPRLGQPLAPNNNINCVPLGHAFGKINSPNKDFGYGMSNKENQMRAHIKKCLAHLNTLRKCLKKRFDGAVLSDLYLKMKYFDKDKTGWLPKEFVYDFCSRRYVRFNASLLEPLLELWNALDGDQVKYNIFIAVINPREESPKLPNVWGMPESDFSTTYSDMIKPDQEPHKRMRAGLPSGRYFDLDYPITPKGYCKADRTYLPQESDAKCCLFPSVFTHFGISHRDMYEKQTPAIVRRVFEKAGEKFTDEKFEVVWNIAKKDHSREWVCFESFRKALDKVNSGNKKSFV